MGRLEDKLPAVKALTDKGTHLLDKEKREGLTPQEKEKLRDVIVQRAAEVVMSDLG